MPLPAAVQPSGETGITWQPATPPAGSPVLVGGGAGGFVEFSNNPDSCDWLCSPDTANFSADGLRWSGQDVGGLFGSWRVMAVTPYRNGFVAVGSSLEQEGDKRVTASAWLSVDSGAFWQRADFGADADAGHWLGVCEGDGINAGGLADVAAVGDRLLAIGSIVNGSNCDSQTTYGLWSSTDGMTWQRLPSVAGAEGATLDAVGARNAFFVAARDADFRRFGTSRIYRSVDGQIWTREEFVEPATGIGHVIAAGSDLLAFGGGGDETTSRQVAWQADNGAWHALPPPAFGNYENPFHKVVALPGHVVAGGTFTVGDAGDKPDALVASGVISSVDGSAWSLPQLDPFSGFDIIGLAANRSAILFAGATYRDSGPAQQMWVGSF